MERAGIDETFVRDLVRDQHPDLADLEIRPVRSGWDKQLWRLGDELAVRLPMTERAPEEDRGQSTPPTATLAPVLRRRCSAP